MLQCNECDPGKFTCLWHNYYHRPCTRFQLLCPRHAHRFWLPNSLHASGSPYLWYASSLKVLQSIPDIIAFFFFFAKAPNIVTSTTLAWTVTSFVVEGVNFLTDSALMQVELAFYNGEKPQSYATINWSATPDFVTLHSTLLILTNSPN